jgi:hypothetical protein
MVSVFELSKQSGIEKVFVTVFCTFVAGSKVTWYSPVSCGPFCVESTSA